MPGMVTHMSWWWNEFLCGKNVLIHQGCQLPFDQLYFTITRFAMSETLRNSSNHVLCPINYDNSELTTLIPFHSSKKKPPLRHILRAMIWWSNRNLIYAFFIFNICWEILIFFSDFRRDDWVENNCISGFHLSFFYLFELPEIRVYHILNTLHFPSLFHS